MRNRIRKERKPPLRRQRGIELTHAARCRIPRIGKHRQPLTLPPGIEALEITLLEIHLTPHLNTVTLRCERSAQAQRDRGDRPQIDGDVFADAPVAARSAALEYAVAIIQGDCQAIDLEFADVPHWCLGGELAHTLVERAQFALVERVGQAEHLRRVDERFESLGGRCAHPLRRRIGRAQFGMLALDIDQLAQQRVKFRVGDRRIVQDIVAVVRVVEQVTKLLRAALDVGHQCFPEPTCMGYPSGSLITAIRSGPSSYGYCRIGTVSATQSDDKFLDVLDREAQLQRSGPNRQQFAARMEDQRDPFAQLELDPMRRAVLAQLKTHDRPIKVARTREVAAHQHRYR